MPPEGVPKCAHGDILRFEEILRFVRAVKARVGLRKVHLTGGEPLVRPGVAELVAMLAAEGVGDLALTTNGQDLAAMAGGLKRAGLHRANVSLDSLDERTFASVTHGGELGGVLEGIEAARREGLEPVKLNTLVLRGYNEAAVARMARWAIEHGCTIRFLELMPIGCAKAQFEEWFVPTDEVRARLEKSVALTPLPARPGASSRAFAARWADGLSGEVGFIASRTQPFCDGCTRLRLTSTGRLISCLASGLGRDVRSLLRTPGTAADATLQDVVAGVLGSKQARGEFSTDHAMPTVGG